LERFFGEPTDVERPVGRWTPHANVTETKDTLTVTAELPGLEAKDVDVAISGDMLTIKGEKKQEKEEKDEHHHVVERSYGAFSRMVRLPAPVAADKIKATFKNGVLTVNLPKTEEAKQKAISVTVE
jgi:HSP20 family protein